jgi:hypothetical protein
MRFNIKINESQLNKLILSEDIESIYSDNADKISTINVSPRASCAVIKNILTACKIKFLTVGQPGNMFFPGSQNDEKKYDIVLQQRFFQWYDDVIKSPDSVSTRGKSFEGLIGGIFGGDVSNGESTTNKNDVYVPPIEGEAQGVGISIKFSQSFTPDGGQLLGGIVNGAKDHLNDDKTGVKEELFKLGYKTINGGNINNIFNLLLNSKNEVFNKIIGEKTIGQEFIKSLLNRDKTFQPITYFMFANYGKTNDIYVYQYKKDDIIEHMVNNIENINFSKSIIGVKNLNRLPPKIVIVKFPQYAKTKRKSYFYDKNFIKTEFKDVPTLALHITKKINGKIVNVANVYRQYSGDTFNYFVTQIITKDELGNKIGLNSKVKIDAINKAITMDIKNLEKEGVTKDNKPFIDKLHDYQTIKAKELFNINVKLSEKGREAALQKIFGDYVKTMNPLIIQDIRKNPRGFIEKLLKVYGCDNGVKQIENALKNVFNVEVKLPTAKYCNVTNLQQPNAVQESVNKVLKTLNEAIEKKK